MKEALSIALVLVLGMAIAAGAALWHVIDEAGPSRVYSDLTTWALMLTLIVGGIVFVRVLLTGLAKLSMGRNAHKAQLVERHTIERERHTIDGRQQAPQILTVDRPADLRQLYPDMARAAIESGRPAQLEAPEAYPVELPTADVWAQLETLFKD